MNWEAIGAIAELGGAIGVIASLFYLAIQIRWTRLNDIKNEINSNYSDLDNFRQSIYSDSEVARIFMDGTANPEKLDDYETFRFMAICESLFMNIEIFWRVLDGREDERLGILVDFLADFLTTPGGQAFWIHPQSLNLTPSFREFISNKDSDSQRRLHSVST